MTTDLHQHRFPIVGPNKAADVDDVRTDAMPVKVCSQAPHLFEIVKAQHDY